MGCMVSLYKMIIDDSVDVSKYNFETEFPGEKKRWSSYGYIEGNYILDLDLDELYSN